MKKDQEEEKFEEGDKDLLEVEKKSRCDIVNENLKV